MTMNYDRRPKTASTPIDWKKGAEADTKLREALDLLEDLRREMAADPGVKASPVFQTTVKAIAGVHEAMKWSQYLRENARRWKVAKIRFEDQIAKPAQADAALTNAYVKLAAFKQGLDDMEEIPDYLKPLYREVLKAMDAVGAAQRPTNQLRMMVQRLPQFR